MIPSSFCSLICLGLGSAVFSLSPAAAQSDTCKDHPELAKLACCNPEKHDKPLPYVTAEQVPLAALLPKPPTNASPVTKVELDELRRFRDGSSEQQQIKACGDYDRRVDRFLSESGIDEKTTKAVISCGGKPSIFQRVYDTEENVTDMAKTEFHRTRPYKLDPGLSPLKTINPTKDTFSYPSGHATYGTLLGLVLTNMRPNDDKEWQTAVSRRMEDFGYSRLVSRVHYRSDVYAGHLAGELIYAALRKNPDFMADLHRTQECVRAILGN